MKMPFGKYVGRELVKVPKYYLTWLAERPDLREPLRTGVRHALDGKEYNPPSVEDLLHEIVKPFDE